MREFVSGRCFVQGTLSRGRRSFCVFGQGKEFIHFPRRGSAGAAGYEGTEGIGEIGGLLDGPAAIVGVQEGRGEGVAGTDGVADRGRVAGHPESVTVVVDQAACGPERYAEHVDCVGRRPGVAEIFEREGDLVGSRESEEGFCFSLVQLNYRGEVR